MGTKYIINIWLTFVLTPIQFRYRDSFLEMYVFPLAGNPTYIKVKQNTNQRLKNDFTKKVNSYHGNNMRSGGWRGLVSRILLGHWHSQMNCIFAMQTLPFVFGFVIISENHSKEKSYNMISHFSKTLLKSKCDIYLWTGLSSMFSTSLSLIHLLLGKKYYVFKISDGSTFSNYVVLSLKA